MGKSLRYANGLPGQSGIKHRYGSDGLFVCLSISTRAGQLSKINLTSTSPDNHSEKCCWHVVQRRDLTCLFVAVFCIVSAEFSAVQVNVLRHRLCVLTFYD